MTDALLSTFATHERINQYRIEGLTDQAWSAETPGGKGRTVRAIAAHIHNVRLLWLKTILKEAPLPPQLDKDSCTRTDTLRA